MGRPVPPSARALTALSLFATLGTLTEAAEHLGVTRSALSHRIAELEKHLGMALVRKIGRRISLTEDGERLLASMGDAPDRLEVGGRTFSAGPRPDPVEHGRNLRLALVDPAHCAISGATSPDRGCDLHHHETRRSQKGSDGLRHPPWARRVEGPFLGLAVQGNPDAGRCT
jgi:hypothetical protein